MVVLKDIIFTRFFTHYEKLVDVNKDLTGKGTLERFTEAVAEEYDAELEPMITAILDNIHSHNGQAQYLPFIGSAYGNESYGYNEVLSLYPLGLERRLNQYLRRMYGIRGTKKCLEVLFNLIGFNYTITEAYSSYSFDSPTTFDDEDRTWDMFCNGCSTYALELTRITGSGVATSQELACIWSIIKFNEPMNAILDSLIVQGIVIL